MADYTTHYDVEVTPPSWHSRERGGYWRRYEMERPYSSRGISKGADSSRACATKSASTQPASHASGKGTPSKSTSSTTA